MHFVFQVFLHILADTLGSVGVIISAILMQMFGWMMADPICSIFIAILIALSVGQLVSESAAILMQRQPKELDTQLPDAYNKVVFDNFEHLNLNLIWGNSFRFSNWRAFKVCKRPISGRCAPTTTWAG